MAESYSGPMAAELVKGILPLGTPEPLAKMVGESLCLPTVHSGCTGAGKVVGSSLGELGLFRERPRAVAAMYTRPYLTSPG